MDKTSYELILLRQETRSNDFWTNKAVFYVLLQAKSSQLEAHGCFFIFTKKYKYLYHLNGVYGT